MSVPSGPVPQFLETKGLHSGSALNKLSNMLGSGGNSITAFAGGGKANATPVTGTNQEVGVVTTTSDSVLLPLGYVGLRIFLANAGAQTMQVFGKGNDVINNVATATGVSQAAASIAIYQCLKVSAGVGYWYRILSA